MRREAKGKRVKQTLDVLIILCGAGAVFLVFKEIGTWRFAPAVYFVIVIGMAAAIYDLFRLSGSKNTEEIMPEAERIQGIQRLILLDEEGKPIKSWDLQGKISLIIGKAGRDQDHRISKPEGPIKPEEMFAAFFGRGSMQEAEKRNAAGSKRKKS